VKRQCEERECEGRECEERESEERGSEGREIGRRWGEGERVREWVSVNVSRTQEFES
jgi:hypothetical protein